MNKKLSIFIVALCISIVLWIPAFPVFAASGKTSVSVSNGNVNIGDTVTVTVKASGPSGEKANATMTLSYDSNVLEFVSCSTTYGGGGNSVMATGESYTVTLKAVGAGTSSLSVSGNDGVLFDTAEEMESMSGSSASVTVNNAAGTGGTANAGGTTGTGADSDGTTTNKTQSADNSLKSLTISPGTLSPEFAGSTTKYTATVTGDVNSIAVSAVPVNSKAVVESVTGNENLTEGSNTIKIVVKAENGVTATYTINVTKQSKNAVATADTPKESEQVEEDPATEEPTADPAGETITMNGAAYRVAENFGEEIIPIDFSENTINYHGTDYRGVKYNNGALFMLYLMPEDTAEAEGKFFVYDGTRDTFYPFAKINNNERYVIALLPPVDISMPEDYLQMSIIAGEGEFITVYQKDNLEESEMESAFFLFYGVNQTGAEGWYQYDGLDGTYQRTNLEESETGYNELLEEYESLSEKYAKERTSARNVIGVLIFILAVLVIVIINLVVFHIRKKEDGVFDDEDYDREDIEDADFDEEELREEEETEKGAWKNRFAGFLHREETPKEDSLAEPKIHTEEKKEIAQQEDEFAERRRASESFFAKKSETKQPEKEKEEEPEVKAPAKSKKQEKKDIEIIDFNDF